MFINWKRRELALKIVYYGPPLSGKTSNLVYIHSRLDPATRGNLVTLKTQNDRTLYFDFMQLELGSIKGFKPKFNLYTIPGQPIYQASRRAVLQGADGVVYVADSGADRLRANLEAMRQMEAHLIELGQDPGGLPLVLQYNKRDLPNAVPVALLRSSLARNGIPQFEAVATRGDGVIDTLKAAISSVVARL